MIVESFMINNPSKIRIKSSARDYIAFYRFWLDIYNGLVQLFIQSGQLNLNGNACTAKDDWENAIYCMALVDRGNHPGYKRAMINRTGLRQNSKIWIVIGFVIGSMLSGCAGSTAIIPTPTIENDAYQASVATIAAQLTGIAGTGQPETTGIPAKPARETPVGDTPAGETPAGETPSETLPATSTPMPTNTPWPSETALPSATSVVSPTTAAGLAPTLSFLNPKASLGEASWIDSFDEGGANWPLYNDEHVNMQVENGELVMTALVANRKDPWDAWMITPTNLGDFYLEATVRTGDCEGLDRYGLLARAAADASQAYVFGLSCDGKYSLRLWTGEKYYMLKEWTPSQAIESGAQKSNVLGLLTVGDQISIYANDQLLTKIQDETFQTGAIGVFAGAAMTDEFSVFFEQVAYWIL